MGFELEIWKKNIEKLKRNREKVPREELRTTYKVSYEKLLREIQQQTKAMIIAVSMSMPVGDITRPAEREAFDEYMERCQIAIDQAAAAGILKEISRAVFREYDPNKAMEITAEKIYPLITYVAYPPYWLRHCRKAADGSIRNDLIRKKWNANTNTWESDDGLSFTLMLPPTEELIEKQKKEMFR